MDSLYRQFSTAATRKYELGESNYLEKLTADTKQKRNGFADRTMQRQYHRQLSRIGKMVAIRRNVYHNIGCLYTIYRSMKQRWKFIQLYNYIEQQRTSRSIPLN